MNLNLAALNPRSELIVVLKGGGGVRVLSVIHKDTGFIDAC